MTFSVVGYLGVRIVESVEWGSHRDNHSENVFGFIHFPFLRGMFTSEIYVVVSVWELEKCGEFIFTYHPLPFPRR